MTGASVEEMILRREPGPTRAEMMEALAWSKRGRGRSWFLAPVLDCYTNEDLLRALEPMV